MAIFTTADGRQIVGAAQAGNEYKGYAGRREIVIQLTATGATQDSLDALEFLKSYAMYHNSVGEPIFPASTNVFISNNGVTKAVEADEVTVDGANVNIGGCVWNGTAWDFTNAGQGGGSSGGGVLVVHLVYNETDDNYYTDKTWKEIHDAPMAVYSSEGVFPDGSTLKNICPIVRVYHEGSEYSVSYHSYSSNGEITVIKLVTDSENGYLTLAE